MSAIEIDFSDPIQALEFTARHWKWLAKNPRKQKWDFPELKKLKRRGAYLYYDCGLCEERRLAQYTRKGGNGFCAKGGCLLYDFWAKHPFFNSVYMARHTTICENSVYRHWRCVKDNETERARLALMISEAAQAKADRLKKEKLNGESGN